MQHSGGLHFKLYFIYIEPLISSKRKAFPPLISHEGYLALWGTTLPILSVFYNSQLDFIQEHGGVACIFQWFIDENKWFIDENIIFDHFWSLIKELLKEHSHINYVFDPPTS